MLSLSKHLARVNLTPDPFSKREGNRQAPLSFGEGVRVLGERSGRDASAALSMTFGLGDLVG